MNRSNVRFQTIGSNAVRAEYTPQFVVLDGGYQHTAHASRRVQDRPYRAHRPTAQEQTLNLAVHMVGLAALASVVVAVSVFIGVSFGFIGTHTSSLSEQPSTQITVLPGDSLWSIAADNPIEGYTTQEIARFIGESNELDSSLLQPGQKLNIPSSQN